MSRFTSGQTLLDLGCGPGYCTRELAYIVGTTGKVIGVDLSKSNIDHVKQDAKTHLLDNIELQNCDFNEIQLTAFQSFIDMEGDINIGRKLPGIFEDLGMKIKSVRPMAKLAYRGDLTWQWPKTFLQIYLSKLVEPGYLTQQEANEAVSELYELERIPGTSILCPQMEEVVAEKR